MFELFCYQKHDYQSYLNISKIPSLALVTTVLVFMSLVILTRLFNVSFDGSKASSKETMIK